MAAGPWTLGLGAGWGMPGRRVPGGVLVDCPSKRTLCATSVAGVRPDGGHLLPGCDLHPILRQLAVGPRPGWVTCPSPISSFPNQAEGGGGGWWLQAWGRVKHTWVGIAALEMYVCMTFAKSLSL